MLATQGEPRDTKRSGRPRFKWVDTNCTYVYKDLLLGEEEYDPEDVSHQDKIKEAANARKF